MKTIKPPKLNIGDTVGIVSPSQPVTNKRYYRHSINALIKLGFNVVLGRNALRSAGFAAGTAEERLEDLHKMFADPAVRAIFTSAGGSASLHLLDNLDYRLIQKNPKIFCGFSDIATLLNAVYHRTGLITFYNFSIERFTEKASDFTIKSFVDLFISDDLRSTLPQKSRWRILRKGRAEGRLIGGNLMTVANTISLAEYFPDPRVSRTKYILFFEEHGTDFEELDNSLHRLGISKVFDHLAGIIIGKITDIAPGGQPRALKPSKDPEFRNRPRPRDLTLYQMFSHIFETYNVRIPIVANVDFGYVRDRITLPIGAKVKMNLNASEPTIKFLDHSLSR